MFGCIMSLFTSLEHVSAQSPITVSPGWSVQLSQSWHVLGPFPIKAREQQYLSPSFPLNLSQPIDYTKQWPSSYHDNGKVCWSTTQAAENGDIEISFPEIRWSYLRNTEGWAVLQHHAVLKSTLTLIPPPASEKTEQPPQLRVQLVQGSHFTILPTNNENNPVEPEWYAGNIYAMANVLPRTAQFPTPPSLDGPTTYDIFVSGDYEIRLFGDPHARGSEVPVQSINLKVEVEPVLEDALVRETTQDVICDFVDGYAFGDAIGIGLRSVAGWWTPTSVQAISGDKNISISLHRVTRVAPTQTRVVPLKITQTKPYLLDTLNLTLSLENSTGDVQTIPLTITVKHTTFGATAENAPIIASYFFAESMPTLFATLPPLKKNTGQQPQPPVMFLHGAGVEITSQDFWGLRPLRQQEHSWIVVPTGRTAWGLDWHGPSTQDAWNSLDSLVSILAREQWKSWSLRESAPVVLMGHSNGGQGAWYTAARFPDRVLAVVPAAGYLKSQAYVPLTMSRAGHFLDPELRAILESSLTPDDNDLFLSNLVDTPIYAIHGGIDDNVPVWHTREAVSVLLSWRPDANVTFYEAPDMNHWFDTIMNNDRVQEFLDSVQASKATQSDKFTLTVSIPAESGSFHGFRIESLITPGRLARLHVDSTEKGRVSIKTENTHTFSLTTLTARFIVDDIEILISPSSSGTVRFERDSLKKWKVSNKDAQIQSSGRIQDFLRTAGPFSIIIPEETSSKELSAALRIAHDLLAYHVLDADISSSHKFSGQGNILIIGNSSTPAVQEILNRQETSFGIRDGSLGINDIAVDIPGTSILFSHPHPTQKTGSVMFLVGTDTAGLGRASRLFPIRTGIPVPDWAIVSPKTDSVGAAGIVGAGVWNREWKWQERTSWLY